MYTEQTFSIGTLDGLSERQIAEHLKLYAGYIKNVNALLEKIPVLEENPAENSIVVSELRRRLGFEWNGMRLHEYYFEALGGARRREAPALSKALADRHGGMESWLSRFKTAGMMRGIGWVLLSLDAKTGDLLTSWVADHEIGTLAGAPILLAMDVWEHAYLLDYLPSQRKDYIETFFKNLDWGVVEERFIATTKY